LKDAVVYGVLPHIGEAALFDFIAQAALEHIPSRWRLKITGQPVEETEPDQQSQPIKKRETSEASLL